MPDHVAAITSRNSPCSCGSGIKFKHCCGHPGITLPGEADLRQLQALHQLTHEAFNRGEFNNAEQGCLTLLSHAPGHVRALRLLCEIRKSAGQHGAVEVLLRRLVALLPNDEWTLSELSLLLYGKRDYTQAEKYARQLVRLNPDNAQGHNLMGMILTDSHRLPAGEFHYRRALALHPPVGKLCANLALNLRLQGKLEEAEALYQQAMQLEPENMVTLMGWAGLKEVERDLKGAWKLLDSVAARVPANDPGIALQRSVLHRRGKNYEASLAALDDIVPERRSDNARYYYERGDVLDRMGRYDEAFAAFEQANSNVREVGNKRYDRAASVEFVTRLKNFFSRDRAGRLPRGRRSQDEPACPVFIVGFPRSGTTMVEQMLTSHDRISAGDELHFIWDLVRIAPKVLNSELPYPECLADLWFGDNQAALENFRDYYLKGSRQIGVIEPGVPYFTDKMPLNETNLGLIHLVFPEAPVIHLLRHPLDVVLSCFFNDLTHGNCCSYALETAAFHYALIRELLDHTLANMDIKYLPVRYEDLVADPEPHCRRLFEFIGVEWDERCLAFHENRRYARTASYAQVTEQLYTRSKFRYRNYRRHLESILPILEPAITRLGYSID